MQISVIIPVFNRQKVAERAIRSALDQKGVDVEVIIVDDGSHPPFALPDDLREAANLRLITLARNSGAAAARNAGIKAARHPWVAFLDSDDRFLPGKLATQAALAGAGAELAAIATHVRFVDKEGRALYVLAPIESDDATDFVSGCWHCPGSTLLIHRSAYERLGYYDENMRRLEDSEWFIRFGLAGGRLRVARMIGAEITAGFNTHCAAVDAAAATIAGQYIAPADRLSPLQKRRLAGYLALEQAAVRMKSRAYLAGIWHLLRSFIAVPRLRLQLKNWWQS